MWGRARKQSKGRNCPPESVSVLERESISLSDGFSEVGGYQQELFFSDCIFVFRTTPDADFKSFLVCNVLFKTSFVLSRVSHSISAGDTQKNIIIMEMSLVSPPWPGQGSSGKDTGS